MVIFFASVGLSYVNYFVWRLPFVAALTTLAMGCWLTRHVGAGAFSPYIQESAENPFTLYSDTNRPVSIVTGASSGIGKGTALTLLRQGSIVVMGCRDMTKAAEVKAEFALELNMTSEQANTMIRIIYLDLDSMDSVMSFTRAFKAMKLPLHALVNNAGAMVTKFKEITDIAPHVGSAFTTNHLGHCLLTLTLLDKIIDHQTRIVNVSSAIIASIGSNITIKECLMNDEATFDAPTAYGRTKMCNVWFTQALQKRLDEIQVNLGVLSKDTPASTDIAHAVATSVHPGTVWSPFHMPYYKDTFYGLLLWFPALMMPMSFFAMKSLEEGARTSVHCAIGRNPAFNKNHPVLSPISGPEPGQFHAECSVSASNPVGFDSDKSEELWKVSLGMIKPYLNDDTCKFYKFLI